MGRCCSLAQRHEPSPPTCTSKLRDRRDRDHKADNSQECQACEQFHGDIPAAVGDLWKAQTSVAWSQSRIDTGMMKARTTIPKWTRCQAYFAVLVLLADRLRNENSITVRIGKTGTPCAHGTKTFSGRATKALGNHPIVPLREVVVKEDRHVLFESRRRFRSGR